MNDLISRQAAIDAMANTLWHYPNECYRNLSEYEFAKGLAELGLKSVPSAPERKTGKWIDGKRMKNDGTFYWFRQCDQCGYERNDCDTEKDSNFCPDCGAKMEGEEDGER